MQPAAHKKDRGDVEITRFELMRIFQGDEDWLHIVETHFFCGHCKAPNRRLINYRVLVTARLYDVVLQGVCSACGHLAARYEEAGEDPVKLKRIKQILKERKKK